MVEVISMEQALREKMPILTEEEIQSASDELYQKVIIETRGNREGRPADEVFEELREKYANF